MDFDALTDRVVGRRLALESLAVFAIGVGFLLALSPNAPFTKELGVCESGAVRDVLAGTVVLPHYAPGMMVQAPPMYWWAAALAVRLLGWNEFALRLPSLLATAATGAVLYAWLAASMTRRAAMWSAAILLSSQYVADAARQPRMDAILMMFLAAAMVCLERAVAQDLRRWVLVAGAGLAMGAAILTKGPLGAILPGIALAVFFAVRGQPSMLLNLKLLAAFALAIAVGATWYGAALHVGGSAFFRFQIVHGLLSRFMGAAAGTIGECQNPFYYYVPRLVSGFLPWSLFYPALAVLMWRDRARMPPPVAFAMCWFAAVLGFFTISAGKCLVYILPLFPALAALVGAFLAAAGTAPRDRDLPYRLFDWASILIGMGVMAILVGLAAIFLSGSAAAIGTHLHRSDRRFLDLLAAAASRGSPAIALWVTCWIAGALIVLSWTVRGRAVGQSVGIALISVVGTLFWYGYLNPALANEVTLKPFASIVDSNVSPGVQISYLGPLDCDLAFYSKHPISSRNSFECTEGSAAAYFLLWQDRLAVLGPQQRGCLAPVAQSAPVDSHGARVLMIERK